MIVVACVEDRMGMLFHQRRVSRDQMVCQDMVEHCPTRLWMNGYSAPLFAALPQEQLQVDEQFMQQAGTGDWCFVENQSIQSNQAEIEGLVLYRWNRKYPADLYFDLDLTQWELQESEDFVGSSHDKITKEVYRRRRIS